MSQNGTNNRTRSDQPGVAAAAFAPSAAIESPAFIHRLRAGDKDAFRALVTDFQHRVYNLALKMLWNREDAEDVLQETFITILNKIGDFQGQSQLSTWIYRIATNAALMKLRERHRDQGRRATLDDVDLQQVVPGRLAPEAPNPFDMLLQQESSAILAAAIDSLPELYSAAFVLKDIEQLPIEEVAAILEISTEAAYSRLKRARMFLREAILREYREQKESPNAMS